MFMMMILSYSITAFLDLKATYDSKSKNKLIIYFILMTISCAIGIASGYVREMPSPADPIKQLVFTLIGK